jgi:hypothetical protein
MFFDSPLELETREQLKQLRENARKSARALGRPFRSSEEWVNYVLKSTNLTVSDLKREGIIFATPRLEYSKHIKKWIQYAVGKNRMLLRAIINAGNDTRFRGEDDGRRWEKK